MTLAQWLITNSIRKAKFAKAIGCSTEAVRRYCTGERIPDRNAMVAIHRATMGVVQPNDFYDLEES